MLKLAFASAAACLVCCLPIVFPFVVGLAGVGMVGMGGWILGSAVVLVAIYLGVKRRNTACGCAEPSECGQCMGP